MSELIEYRVVTGGGKQHGIFCYRLSDARHLLRHAPPYSRLEQRTVTTWVPVPDEPKGTTT